MGDAVTTQTLFEDSEKLIMMFTNVSDGTGESAVVKVDVSNLTPACAHVAIEKVKYSVGGMQLQILWDATTPVKAIVLNGVAGSSDGCIDFSEEGGLRNTKASGYTGDIKFTTVLHSVNDSYSILMVMRKVKH